MGFNIKQRTQDQAFNTTNRLVSAKKVDRTQVFSAFYQLITGSVSPIKGFFSPWIRGKVVMITGKAALIKDIELVR
jgi:hypothetical protein